MNMTIIEVRPSKKFPGAWVAFEGPGVGPAFAAPDAKRKAIDYACGRFGGGAGEVHVFGDDGATIGRWIVIDGRGQYPQGDGNWEDHQRRRKDFQISPKLRFALPVEGW